MRYLPLVNALLNSTSTILLLCGFVLIRKKKVRQHRILMLTALSSSCLFLISYVVYHQAVGSIPFRGVGPIRMVYFTILGSHTLLAAAVPFLAGITLSRALRRKFSRHKAIARWTLPVWLYVSVTGVIIYIMLYQLYPAGQIPAVS